jgi:hypothetical protein
VPFRSLSPPPAKRLDDGARVRAEKIFRVCQAPRASVSSASVRVSRP